MRRAIVLVLLAYLIVVALLATHAAAAVPGQRIDLRVLLLSADGTEPSFAAWKTALAREGVPYDEIVATQAPPLTAATFAASSSHARYQAIVLATGGLAYFDGSTYTSALDQAEWDALAEFERSFGIRQVTAFVYPSPEYGLNWPTYAGGTAGIAGNVTAAGQAVFPYLVGEVPLDPNAYGYLATPLDASFTTLVEGPSGSALVGVNHRPDGREEAVVTVDGNPSMIHNQLLRHGLLSWVTRGVFVGIQRDYFSAHIDDVFLNDDRWDTAADFTPEPSPVPIRMTAEDVTRALAWSQRTGIRLDFAYNAEGAVEGDALTAALLASKASFGWINHTFSHPNLDNVDQATIVSEIGSNIAFGQANQLPFDPRELVTGEHSGLANPNMPAALQATGVTWIAADNSRQPSQTAIGSALTVPRHPSNVYYNVGTWEEQLDEYNYIYLPPPAGICVNTATTTCRSAPATQAEYIDSEVGIMFGHVLGNDPRPHYFHQSNLAEEAVLYPVLDTLLERYNRYLRSGLVNLSMAEAGLTLQRQNQLASAVASGGVTAYLLDNVVHLEVAAPVEVPLTGTAEGSLYGGQRSGWVPAGTAAVPVPDPASTGLPAITGTVAVGQTLTATPGEWTGTQPISLSYQWQRCASDGTACTGILGATGTTYVPVAADGGSSFRVAVTASNAMSAWNTAVSEPTATLGGVPAGTPPANTAIPAISGTAQVGQTLTATNGAWDGDAPITYAHQWLRCAAPDIASCTPIPGATGTTYLAVSADSGTTLRVTVTATNETGQATATSDPTAPVGAASPPVSTAPPTIAGTARSGSTLTASNGAWSGSEPIAYTYQWRRCTTRRESSCTPIDGATQQSYTAAAADVGQRLRVSVTASNPAGQATAGSASTAIVTAIANVAAPTITGNLQVGQTLTATDGVWSGGEPITYTYQWLRCQWGRLSSCSAIAGATAQTYVLVDADRTFRMRVTVTATNAGGQASATSGTTARVA